MRMRSIWGGALGTAFVAVVVHAATANQCPARELGACAKMHLALMRPPPAASPLVLAAEPMRAGAERG
jgi:hypothetical protein